MYIWNPSNFSVNYATSAGLASTVTVNDSNSNSSYRIVWHSGNTLYSTSDVTLNASTDKITAKGFIYNGINNTNALLTSSGSVRYVGIASCRKNGGSGNSTTTCLTNNTGCITISYTRLSDGHYRIYISNSSNNTLYVAHSLAPFHSDTTYEKGFAHFYSSLPAGTIGASSGIYVYIRCGYTHMEGSWSTKDFTQVGDIGGFVYSIVGFSSV